MSGTQLQNTLQVIFVVINNWLDQSVGDGKLAVSARRGSIKALICQSTLLYGTAQHDPHANKDDIPDVLYVQYCKWANLSLGSQDQFWTDATAMKLVQNHLYKLANRK